MGRAPCCDKANVKKGPWSPEEDSKLKDYIEKFGTGGNWIALPHKAGNTKIKQVSSLSLSNGCFLFLVFTFKKFTIVFLHVSFLMIRLEKMWKELQIEMAKLSETQY